MQKHNEHHIKCLHIMAQWAQMTQHIQFLTTEVLNELYPVTFPLDIRHYLASWIEGQQWDSFDVDNREQESQAQLLSDQMVMLLHQVAKQNPNVVEKVKLQHMSKNWSVLYPQPLQLVRTVREILRKERLILSQTNMQFPPFAPPPTNGIPQQAWEEKKTDVENLMSKVMEIQNRRQTLHQLQEELNWEKETIQGLSEMDTGAKQKRIQQIEYNATICAQERVQFLCDAVGALEQCQSSLMLKIESWRWEQHRSTIGMPFNDILDHLQTWSEQLLIVNGNLRQELMLMKVDHGDAERLRTLEENLARLLKTLIQNSLVVEKQPPQVIKTQSKFSTTVRYLLGDKMAPGKPVLLKAQIITEAQARNLGQQSVIPNENVGELLNSTTILEHNTTSKNTCATFRNMSIRRIKRADRKGSESVTEEKFALLFTTDITITGGERPYSLQSISLPVVVIVHGSQEINAMATIIWDCAFSEPNRIPFLVPERVSWQQMCGALSSKFMSEVQTTRGLDPLNLRFLGQKIFDQPDHPGDFENMLVSWAQFNKEVLPGRNFTFWQWFEGAIDLTKRCLRDYWTDGLIFGFIGKQYIHCMLQDKTNGFFLLRFSDSEIGGITIAYVEPTENGGRRVQNIQPFTKKDLDSAGLGDRIRDISCISHVYPGIPKNEAFKKYFTVPSAPNADGYLPFKLTTVVNPGDNSTSTNNITSENISMNFISPSTSQAFGQNMNQDIYNQHCTPSYSMPDDIMPPQPMYPTDMQVNPPDEFSEMEEFEGLLSSI
ncbi:signal transducer and activator of transcription 6 isoform X1 [Danio rerio]|uniref:Signal transducer and activator of transcription 6 isoform X1 n=2 Tax=Danio rerio TaxID=7955 RepID=A0AC58IJ02_DANRE